QLLDSLRAAGFNRLSLGMQSASEQVLAVLERRHTPGRAVAAVWEAEAAGFSNINLDLIYGTPGETMAQWQDSLDAALAVRPTHLSAYALTLEPHTALARRIAAAVVPPVDEDDLADKYLVAEKTLVAAGLTNYEVSNWSLPGYECRHNMAYWLGEDWWGAGPGAHSHVAGQRWWNARSPRRWAELLADGHYPSEGAEVLDATAQHTERVLLRLRLASGLPLRWLPDTAEVAELVAGYLKNGLVSVGDNLVLTPPGRLLADRIALELLST
ncbi:MAG: radical SAM protein, partial [Propionibacteriaceae bacterium]|nr:radical SAM protein [Propionibacteriaceae bacterium]